jgi:ATP-binding cassette subfamily B protein
MYPDASDYVLQNISFKANRGETIAFIGSTGSGKSTLINLIPRFYDVTEGEILINGIPLKKVRKLSKEEVDLLVRKVARVVIISRCLLFYGTLS